MEIVDFCPRFIRYNRYYRPLAFAAPLKWQAEAIRAAIALKLCVYEETSTFVAALLRTGALRGRACCETWRLDCGHTLCATTREVLAAAAQSCPAPPAQATHTAIAGSVASRPG